MSRKRTDEVGRAFEGSQLQIQIYVNRHQSELDAGILSQLPTLQHAAKKLAWVSPLEADRFREYHDRRFLDAVDLSRLANEMAEFWPPGGPHWDALARVELKQGGAGVLLVEAKSHVNEMVSVCDASDPDSIRKIRSSLDSAKAWYNAPAGTDWFSQYYQLANRLAHVQFLHEKGVRVWLAHVCFLRDPYRPTDLPTWQAGLATARRALGIGQPREDWVADVFLPAFPRSELVPDALPVDAERSLRDAERAFRKARRDVLDALRAGRSPPAVEELREEFARALRAYSDAVDAICHVATASRN